MLGIFIGPLPAEMVLALILARKAALLGIDPKHFTIIVIVTLIIGMITPPVGGLMFITAMVAKVSKSELNREPWSMMLLKIGVLALITLVPPSAARRALTGLVGRTLIAGRSERRELSRQGSSNLIRGCLYGDVVVLEIDLGNALYLRVRDDTHPAHAVYQNRAGLEAGLIESHETSASRHCRNRVDVFEGSNTAPAGGVDQELCAGPRYIRHDRVGRRDGNDDHSHPKSPPSQLYPANATGPSPHSRQPCSGSRIAVTTRRHRIRIEDGSKGNAAQNPVATTLRCRQPWLGARPHAPGDGVADIVRH